MGRCIRICILLAAGASVLLVSTPALAKPHDEAPAIGSSESEEDGATGVSRDRRRRRARSCKQRIKQIIYYDNIATAAKSRGDDAWRDSTFGHVRFLEEQMRRPCPELYAQRKRDKRMVYIARYTKDTTEKVLKVAAKAAKYFATGGGGSVADFFMPWKK